MVARIASDDREFLEQYECFAHYFLFSQRVHSEYTNVKNKNIYICIWAIFVHKQKNLLYLFAFDLKVLPRNDSFLILEMTYFRNTC